MIRMLIAAAILAACTFDVNVHGIPSEIALTTPNISLLPQAPRDAGGDATDAGGDQ